MQFTKEDLDSFKQIYKEEFGEEISDAEARRVATKLVNLVKIIYKPYSKD